MCKKACLISLQRAISFNRFLAKAKFGVGGRGGGGGGGGGPGSKDSLRDGLSLLGFDDPSNTILKLVDSASSLTTSLRGK